MLLVLEILKEKAMAESCFDHGPGPSVKVKKECKYNLEWNSFGMSASERGTTLLSIVLAMLIVLEQ